jgi:cellulose synthase/poly-beta-1,6-N-acetylglucosamine synthase-like glycosyltransferase
MSGLSLAWLVWTVLLVIPVLILFMEVLVGAPGRRDTGLSLPAAASPRIAVLVPAHDESIGIVPTLEAVKMGIGTSDRLLVVADNCGDDTAHVARNAGAEVIERFDRENRGKGYALDFGVRHLERGPPEVVVVVDADCRIDADSLHHIADLAKKTGRPVQALYLMRAPVELGLGGRMAEFAWRVKNLARPFGLHRMGLPCQLMGTGMAFPWAVLSQARLASGHIVEDLQLGLDLARSGKPPLFAPRALVTSSFPLNKEGATSQRTRWEHGHLLTITAHAPALLWHALRSGNLALLALTIDLMVPPLALLAACVIFTSLLSGIFAAVALEIIPSLLVSLTNLLLLAATIGIAWWRYARDIVSPRDLLLTPGYVLRKLPIYLRFLTGRQVKWVRARRDG